MGLRIATWNVNSLRQRLEHLARFAETHAPDVICLQETKVDDSLFPEQAIADMGYPHILRNGQKSYNGVAILSRRPFSAGGHERWCEKDDCRHLVARFDDLELHNFYVPSGGDRPDPEANDKFAHKIRFLEEMADWARQTRAGARKLVLVGDLNVAPLESDVWNHKRLVRSVGHTPRESALMAALGEAGPFIDVPRRFVPPDRPLYTWWGYRYPQSFAKDYGWRLDHVLASPALEPALAGLTVARETRGWERPSDHVPVLLELA